MAGITSKQVKALKVLNVHAFVIASFDQHDLSWLERYGFAHSSIAYAASGKLSRSKVWTITDRGREFLQNERAGQ